MFPVRSIPVPTAAVIGRTLMQCRQVLTGRHVNLISSQSFDGFFAGRRFRRIAGRFGQDS